MRVIAELPMLPSACCFSDGSCSDLFYDECLDVGGCPGFGFTCDQGECPQLGACCMATADVD